MLSAKEAQNLGVFNQAERAIAMQKRIDEGYLEKEMDIIGNSIEANAADRCTRIHVVDFLPEYKEGKGAIKLQSIARALRELGYETDFSCSTNPENENMKITW